MQIHIDAHELLLQAKRFKGLKANLQRAIREGLNQGGNKVTTDVRRALWKQTGLRQYKSIVSRTVTVGATDGGGGDYSFVIKASGKGIPIKEFTVKVKKGPGGGVLADPWGVPHQFKRSFGLSGGGYRARLPGQRVTFTGKDGKIHRGFKLRSLYGPSIAKEAMQGMIPRVFETSVLLQVQPVILARIARALQAAP